MWKNVKPKIRGPFIQSTEVLYSPHPLWSSGGCRMSHLLIRQNFKHVRTLAQCSDPRSARVKHSLWNSCYFCFPRSLIGDPPVNGQICRQNASKLLKGYVRQSNAALSDLLPWMGCTGLKARHPQTESPNSQLETWAPPAQPSDTSDLDSIHRFAEEVHLANKSLILLARSQGPRCPGTHCWQDRWLQLSLMGTSSDLRTRNDGSLAAEMEETGTGSYSCCPDPASSIDRCIYIPTATQSIPSTLWWAPTSSPVLSKPIPHHNWQLYQIKPRSKNFRSLPAKTRRDVPRHMWRAVCLEGISQVGSSKVGLIYGVPRYTLRCRLVAGNLASF